MHIDLCGKMNRERDYVIFHRQYSFFFMSETQVYSRSVACSRSTSSLLAVELGPIVETKNANKDMPLGQMEKNITRSRHDPHKERARAN